MIDLTQIQSPILFRGDAKTAYRDPAAVWQDGWCHLFFTLVETEADGRVFMYTAKSKSRDLVTWTEPRKLTPRDQRLNYSSPGNIIWHHGKWVLCLQTYCRENGEKYGNHRSRLYVVESDDLENFSSPRLLRVKGDIPEEEMGRMIDPYLLRDREDPELWWCFFKQNGVSMSVSRDLIHWNYVGHTEAGENVCVVEKDNRYYMFHSPDNGIGVMQSENGTDWTHIQHLFLGQEDWPWAQGRITAGFVIPAKTTEGETWLMFFHGSGPEDEKTMFDHHASLGIAWSRDLENWCWPGKSK